MLNAVEDWRSAGLIDNASARRMRGHFEERRAALLAPLAAADGATSGCVAASPDRPVERRSRAAPLRAAIAERAARRQADVLLYVGAFLLVISAFIFVSSRDGALAGPWRVAILAIYTLAFIVAGWLLQRWPRVREAGPAFLAIGALMAPLNFLLLHNEVLNDRDAPGALVWFIASLYSTAFYTLLFAAGAGRLYAVPAGVAVLSAWGSLAVTAGVAIEWTVAWWIVFAFVVTDASAAVSRFRDAVVTGVGALAVIAALAALAVALMSDEHAWQLPVTLTLLAALVARAGMARRDPVAVLGSVTLVTAAAIAALWAIGVEAEWYGFPALLAAGLLLAARPGWVASAPPLGFGALMLAGAGALAPLLLLGSHLDGDSAIAAAAFLGSALLLAAIAWRDTAEGFRPRIRDGTWPGTGVRPTHPAERVLFGWLAFAAALASLGFAQRAQGLSPPDTGWLAAAVAAGASAAMVLAARERPALTWAILPAVLVATAASLHPAEEFTGHDALLLALSAVHVVTAFGVLRHWVLAVAGTALAMAAMAVLWEVQAWQWWQLAAVYAAGGAALFGVLAPLRRYERPRAGAEGETVAGVLALSWLPSAAAVGVAFAALAVRVEETGAEAAATVEYRALVLLVLTLGVLVAVEARRLGRWQPAAAAHAVGLGVVAALWPVFGWPAWTLAVTWSAAGGAVFAALTRWRRPGLGGGALWVQAITWSGLVLGPLAALWALEGRVYTTGESGPGLVEFRALAVLFIPLAAAVVFEGRRLGVRWAYLPASALAMVALELAIATLEPGNVQAHTVPAAIYLALVGLTARSSERLSDNAGWHEVLQVAGAALLVLPQAAQGFDPGGARWGLVLLVEGLALLGVALALNTRWLAASAVATLSGVALRFLWVNRNTEAVPYWVMLAAAGFALLAVGLTVLLQREWWDRTRLRLRTRWRQDSALDARASAEAPVAALLSTLAPVLAILLVAVSD